MNASPSRRLSPARLRGLCGCSPTRRRFSRRLHSARSPPTRAILLSATVRMPPCILQTPVLHSSPSAAGHPPPAPSLASTITAPACARAHHRGIGIHWPTGDYPRCFSPPAVPTTIDAPHVASATAPRQRAVEACPATRFPLSGHRKDSPHAPLARYFHQPISLCSLFRTLCALCLSLCVLCGSSLRSLRFLYGQSLLSSLRDLHAPSPLPSSGRSPCSIPHERLSIRHEFGKQDAVSRV